MVVGDEKITPVVNGEEEEILSPSEEETSQEIKFVEDKEVKINVDGNEIKVKFDKDNQSYIEDEEIPEDVKNQKDYLDKIGVELGHHLSKVKTVLTEHNELLRERDTLKDKSTLQAEKIARYEKESKDRQKEIELLRADKEKGEYLSIGADYETSYQKKLMEELDVKTQAEAAEQMGTVEYLNASAKAMAFAQAESLKTSSRTSREAMRLQGRNTELSTLVRVDGKVSPEKVIAYRDVHGMSNDPADWVYSHYLHDHPQRDLADESNKLEQKRSTKIKVLKKSRVLPETPKKPTFQEIEKAKLIKGIKHI